MSQPRIAEIMKMKLDHYTIDLLLKYLNRLGGRASLILGEKDEVA